MVMVEHDSLCVKEFVGRVFHTIENIIVWDHHNNKKKIYIISDIPFQLTNQRSDV